MLTLHQKLALLAGIEDDYEAKLSLAVENNVKQFHVETFDLSTAISRKAPYELGFQFRSFLVISATDANATFRFLPNSKDESQETGAPFNVNGQFVSDYPVARGFFYWEEQAGKTITVIFFRSSVQYPGKYATSISQVFASITTATKGSGSVPSSITTSAAVLVPADADMKQAIFQLAPDAEGPVWVGSSGVQDDTGTKVGTRVEPGGSFEHDCSGALYAVAKTAVTKWSINVYK